MSNEELPLLKIVHDKKKYEDIITKIQSLLEDKELLKKHVREVISNPVFFNAPPYDGIFEVIKKILTKEELADCRDVLETNKKEFIDLIFTDYVKIFSEYKKEKDEEDAYHKYSVIPSKILRDNNSTNKNDSVKGGDGGNDSADKRNRSAEKKDEHNRSGRRKVF